MSYVRACAGTVMLHTIRIQAAISAAAAIEAA
jgi:hypothetical protein